jgi:ADP-ribose pyrophosphatase
MQYMNFEKPISKQPLPDNAKLVFKGVIFDVYQWETEGYDGRKKIFEKIKRQDTVIVIPVTNDGRIIIAEQEQPGKQPYVALLGGRVDEGEDILAAAKRELLEESGYEASDWELYDAVQPITKIDWSVYTFIAKGCKKVSEPNLDGAEKVKVQLVSFDEFVDIVLSDKFSDIELKLKIYEAKLDPVKMAAFKKLILD